MWKTALAVVALMVGCASDEGAPIEGTWSLVRTSTNLVTGCPELSFSSLVLVFELGGAPPIRPLDDRSVPGWVSAGSEVLAEDAASFVVFEFAYRTGTDMVVVPYALRLEGGRLVGSSSVGADGTNTGCRWNVTTTGTRL